MTTSRCAPAILPLLLASTAVAQAPGVAAGYAAKMICSTAFVSGRNVKAALKEDLILAGPESPLFARDGIHAVPYRVDRDTRSVVAWVPGQASRRAVYRDGLGCTLQADSAPVPGPRTKALRVVAVRAPWPLGDEVDTANLPAGVDGALLRAALDSAFAEPDPSHLRRTRAIVIAWRGRIVAERYAGGYDANTPQLGWSMTKSVTNALVGVLVRQGKMDPKRPVAAPEWSRSDDPRAKIRLDDLMRMSSGLAFDENYTGGESDVAKDLFLVADAGAYAASKPLERPVGSRWEYSSGTTNIISREIRRVIGNDSAYLDFPHRVLFEPLGIRTATIEPDPSGTFVGSSYMYASARDWARLGQLYLNDGMWNGKRILAAGWVAYSTTPAAADTTGGYGAQVWINRGTAGGVRPFPHLPADAFFFLGHDQQNVAIIPSRGLVAVRLGYTPTRGWDLDRFLNGVLAALPAKESASH